MREPGADSRYRILESVRRFALAQATPEAIEAARDRFATALLARFPLDTSVSRFFPTVPPIAEAHRHALLAILRRGQQHGTPRALGRAFEAAVLLSESAVGAIIGPAIFEDVAALLERQFDKTKTGEVLALVNEMFDRDWKDKASQPKKPERAFETYTRPSRKNLH